MSAKDRVIAEPEFPGDDGAADPGVTAALAAYDADPGAEQAAALAAVQDSRLLVPVVATVAEVEHDEHGRAHEKTSEMAAVLITGRDGRTALLAFTSTTSLQAWNPEARPVAVSARQAARAALQDGADAVLVDVAGPVMFPVEGSDLRDLAAGLVLRRLRAPDGAEGWGWTTSM